MITTTQLAQMLDQYGVTMPSFILDAAVSKANSVEACLDGAGYSDADKTLIQIYAATVIAGATDTRKIKSRHAASGASQSFDYGKGFTSLRRTLAALDTSGCTAAIIGPDPVAGCYFDVVGA